MFLFGGLGGVLPTIATLAGTLVSNPEMQVPAIGYWLGLVLWALVGGGIALTNSSPDVRQAVFAGIAAPAILAGVISGAGEANVRRKTAEQTSSFAISLGLVTLGLVQPASAQIAGSSVPRGSIDAGSIFSESGAAPNTIIIKPEVNGGLPSSVSIPVQVQVPSTQGPPKEVAVGAIFTLSGPTVVSVPNNATAVIIGGQLVPILDTIPTTIELSVRTKPSSVGDFFWALGAKRSYTVQDFQAKGPAYSAENRILQ